MAALDDGLTQLFAIGNQLTLANNIESVKVAFEDAADFFGAKNYSAQGFINTRHREADIYIGNYSKEWLEGDAFSTGRDDPVIQHARISQLPIWWDRTTYEQANATQKWENIKKGTGLECGFGIGLHLAPGRHFLTGFSYENASQAKWPKDRLLSFIQVFALHAEAAVHRVWGAQAVAFLAPEKELTGPQLACLELIARGFTDEDAAKQLEISARAARHLIEQCIEKLEVTNRTEAAVVATRLGLIFRPNTVNKYFV